MFAYTKILQASLVHVCNLSIEDHLVSIKPVLKPAWPREYSLRRACRLLAVSEIYYRYERKSSDDNAIVANWLVRLTYSN